MLGSRCPEHRGDLLSMWRLPAMAGHISPSPLSPHFLLEGFSQSLWISPRASQQGGVAVEKVSDPPPAPLAAPLLFRPIGSARGSCSMPTKSLFHLQSLKCQRRQCRVSELPPDPISSQSPLHLPSSLHLQDRGCDFPLTLATAVTRNCRAGSKLQIQRDKDYFPQKRGENCCICKDFPGPVPSRAHLSGVTPSFKHPSFHSRSRNHLH